MMLPAPVHYAGHHCQMSIEHPLAGLVVLRIEGRDIGEFGARPLRSLDDILARAAPVELYIDARRTRSASLDVSGQWARWLRERREDFQHVSMLTGSRFIEITAGFVRRFAELDDLMRVYQEPEDFDAALLFSLAHARRGAAAC